MVDESLQGQGFGKVAIKEFIRYFKEKYPDVKQLYTSAEVDNQIAISIYEKFGFVKENEFTYRVYEKTYREIRMMLDL